ncbi:MAG: DMT family transporter [Lachnospiraceae bacterium]
MNTTNVNTNGTANARSNTKLTNGVVVCILAMLCCALWGSAFPAIKLGYAAFNIPSDASSSQLLFAGIRFTIAGLLALLFGSILNRKLLIPKKSSFPMIVKLSLVQTVAQYIFFYIGLAHTTGVKGSILISSNVFLSILIPSLILKQETLTFKKVIGCLIGFAGVVLINLNGSEIDMSLKWNGEGFILMSSLSYTISSIMVKSYSKYENPVVLSGCQFVIGGIILMIVGTLLGGNIGTASTKGMVILLYLAFVSAFSYSLWSILLKYNPVGRVAVYGFMNPVCGVLLSALLLKESSQAFGVVGILSLVLVCCGIYLVNHVKNKT